MNKEQFIAWVNSLPEDFECLPFEIREVKEEHSPWEYASNEGMTYQSVYKKTVTTNMKLDITFKGQVSAEFKRHQSGAEQWANFKVVK